MTPLHPAALSTEAVTHACYLTIVTGVIRQTFVSWTLRVVPQVDSLMNFNACLGQPAQLAQQERQEQLEPLRGLLAQLVQLKLRQQLVEQEKQRLELQDGLNTILAEIPPMTQKQIPTPRKTQARKRAPVTQEPSNTWVN